MIRILRFQEAFRAHTNGIGRTRMETSLMRLMTQSARKIVDSSVKHAPGVLMSHVLRIGLHLNTFIKKAGK